uniref:Sigma non-opioid intracellular receptor 1 n=1 Tax=Panagrolaimus sp. JU765 TaxID=591449 RepID=A0AC34Q906_9BILA
MLVTRLVPSFVWKILVFVLIIRALPSLKPYEFVAKTFKDSASKAVSKGGDGIQAVETLVADLRRSNGKSIPKNLFWIPFSIGGMQLKGQIIYPGLMEYIAAFYAPFDTTGSSGFHWSNSSCTVLSGEVSRINDLSRINDRVITFSKETYKVGQQFRQGEFEGYIYHLSAGTSVACYGRGVVPISGVWSTMGAIVNGNPVSILMQGYVYGEAYYHWIINSAVALWNKNAPKQWRTEL